MNYRHLYHAGNFADVLKHAVLIYLLETLQKKPAPYCVLDTHAGIGLYPLQSEAAQKKQEYQQGMTQLLLHEKNITDPTLLRYCGIVKNYNVSAPFLLYPGSPALTAKIIRPQDQLILCELHPEDYQSLKKNMHGKKNVAIHHYNGYQGMKAFLPPKQKRGLVLIDPPFEVTNEFEQVVAGMQIVKKHWQSGQVMIWYPIKNKHAVSKFYNKMAALGLPQFHVELSLKKIVEGNQLSSCGVLLVNPPWKTEEVLRNSLLPQLAKALDADWHISS